MKTDSKKQHGVKRPDWFRHQPGFKWFDNDGDLCVYLGIGAIRVPEDVLFEGVDSRGNKHVENNLTIVFKPTSSEIYAYHYNDEWFLGNLKDAEQDSEWDWSGCTQTKEVDKCVSCKDYFNAEDGVVVVEVGTAQMNFKCDYCHRKSQ